jgi:polar amino acid transport system substrate-binding protein
VVTENNPPFNFAEGTEIKGTATDAVRAMLAKAGVQGTFTVMKWDEAYGKAQTAKITCIISTARLENRERLFKRFGPIGTNV